MPFRMDEKVEEQQGTTAPNISGIQGVGSVDVGLNVPQGAARAGKSEPQKSGQYQNLQQYLRSNQPQTQALAGRLTSEVESRVGEAEKAGEAFKAEAPKVQAYDPTEVLKQFTVPQGTGATVGLPQEQVGAATEPIPGQQKQRQENYLMQRQTGGFVGPTDITQFGTYGAFKKAGEKAQEALKAAGSETGQRELLKTVFARPTYAGGQSALDQALFAQSPAGQQALAQLSTKYAGLGEALKGFERQAQKGLSEAQKQAAENIAKFKPAEQAAEKAILSPIEQRAAEANLRTGEYQKYLQDLADLNLSPETMAALGLGAGERTWGLNLGQYMNLPAAEASVQNIASSAERQRYNDLMNFIGANAQQLGLGQPTFQQAQFDVGRFRENQAAKAQEFQNQLKQQGFSGNYESDLNALNQQEAALLADLQTAEYRRANIDKDPNWMDWDYIPTPEAIDLLRNQVNAIQGQKANLQQIANTYGYSNMIRSV